MLVVSDFVILEPPATIDPSPDRLGALRVAVLVVLQGVEYGAEFFVASGLEVFERGGGTGELGEASRQPGAFAGCQDTPGEETQEARAIGPRRGVRLVFQGVFQQVAE